MLILMLILRQNVAGVNDSLKYEKLYVEITLWKCALFEKKEDGCSSLWNWQSIKKSGQV